MVPFRYLLRAASTTVAFPLMWALESLQLAMPSVIPSQIRSLINEDFCSGVIKYWRKPLALCKTMKPSFRRLEAKGLMKQFLFWILSMLRVRKHKRPISSNFQVDIAFRCWERLGKRHSALAGSPTERRKWMVPSWREFGYQSLLASGFVDLYGEALEKKTPSHTVCRRLLHARERG